MVKKLQADNNLPQTGYVDRATASLDEALRWADEARARREPLSIAIHGNAAEVHPELARRGTRVDPEVRWRAAVEWMRC